jgi:CheY-like chemotaxis protein
MKKILIVEDDGNIALSLEIRLKAAGYELRTAADALTAVKAVEAFRPDLLLVDIAIPAGGGFWVVERLQEDPELSRIPFIFVTASQAPGVPEKAEALGAFAFLNKPYDFSELLASIREALASEQEVRS